MKKTMLQNGNERNDRRRYAELLLYDFRIVEESYLLHIIIHWEYMSVIILLVHMYHLCHLPPPPGGNMPPPPLPTVGENENKMS